MVIIFWFSHQTGRESSKQSNYVKKQVQKVGVKKKNSTILIRKTAHLIIYMSLGISLIMGRRQRGKKEIIESVVIIIIYAALDECHQSFIPGREAYLRDVIIDAVGGSTGILFTKLILWGNTKKGK